MRFCISPTFPHAVTVAVTVQLLCSYCAVTVQLLCSYYAGTVQALLHRRPPGLEMKLRPNGVQKWPSAIKIERKIAESGPRAPGGPHGSFRRTLPPRNEDPAESGSEMALRY